MTHSPYTPPGQQADAADSSARQTPVNSRWPFFIGLAAVPLSFAAIELFRTSNSESATEFLYPLLEPSGFLFDGPIHFERFLFWLQFPLYGFAISRFDRKRMIVFGCIGLAAFHALCYVFRDQLTDWAIRL